MQNLSRIQPNPAEFLGGICILSPILGTPQYLFLLLGLNSSTLDMTTEFEQYLKSGHLTSFRLFPAKKKSKFHL